MPELIFDELVEENFTAQGGAVFQLDGARDYRFPFSSALRADGVTPAQAGDLFPCTFVAAPNLVISCIAEYTPGSPALLEIDSGNIYKTSALGGGIPNFGTKTGIVGLAQNAQLLFLKNLTGGLANPDAVRNSVIVQTMKAFKAQAALLDFEAVLAQCGNNTDDFSSDLLGGLIAADPNETDPADEEDIFALTTGGKKGVRRSIKAWRTRRNVPIAAGGVVSVVTANQPNALYGAFVQDRVTKTIFAEGKFRGDASSAAIVEVFEPGGLEFDLSGADVRIRNRTAGALNVDITPGRIA